MSPRSKRKYNQNPQPLVQNAPVGLTCFGYCDSCKTYHSLPQSEAIPEAYALMEQLRLHGRIDFEVPLEQANPIYNLDFIYKHMGQMFGVLVCEDTNKNRVVLKAFSARHQYVWNCPGWVPPLVPPETYEELVVRGDSLIKPITQQIESLKRDSNEWLLARKQRKQISHQIMEEFFDLYTLHNFCGEIKGLREAYVFENQIPMGTGDCCAPKLLNEAAQKKLKPIAIAEFYWGKGTLDLGRIEGEFYPSCEGRCQPILGFLLCGHQNLFKE